MPADDELLDALRGSLLPDSSPDPARVAALRSAVEARAALGSMPGEGPRSGAPAAQPTRRWRTPVLIAAAALVAVIAAFGVGRIVDTESEPDPPLEFAATLRSDDGSVGAEVEGTKVDEGRIVHLVSRDLPILPTGELYEVWFAGPGDTPWSPNRISAGTFHPDAKGQTDIELTAAVDPTLNPVVVITAEPGDGNPAPSDVEVLRARVDLR